MTRLLTVILSAVIFSSCEVITGSGNIITETRNVRQFEGIKSSGSVDVEIVDDNSRSLKVEADDNVLPYVITKVEDGTLNIYLKSNRSYRDVKVMVYVSSPLLSQLSVSGSGSITAKDTLRHDEQIEIKASGSGDINALVDAPSIIANVSGAGNVNLRGRTRDFTCSVSGGGDLDCKNLLSENTIVKVSGGGNAYVYASVTLDARASGGGNIVYGGKPTSPKIKKSGGGSISAE